MVTSIKQDDFQKTALRLPKGLHAQLHEAAGNSGRSYNAEIISRLTASFTAGQANEVLNEVLNKLIEEALDERLKRGEKGKQAMQLLDKAGVLQKPVPLQHRKQ